MKSIPFSLLIIATLLLTACNLPEDRSKVEEKKAIVMEGHDIAMAKMGEMAKLKKALKTKQASIDSTQKELYTIAIADLEYADKIMWDWMHGYKIPVADTSKVEIALKYLDEQGQKINIVASEIELSLKNGYELLEK